MNSSLIYYFKTIFPDSNNGLKRQNKHAIYCSFAYTHVAVEAYMYIDCESVYSWSSAVKQTSETLR